MAQQVTYKDYYAILEVKPSATHAEIKTAYRRLVLLHHPDKNPGSKRATEKTQQINRAWETLRNTILRRAYDLKYTKTPQPSTTSTAQRTSANAAPTPKPTPQPPNPDIIEILTKHLAEIAKSQRKRQEEYLKTSNQLAQITEQIRQCQEKFEDLEAEVAALNRRIQGEKATLTPYYRWTDHLGRYRRPTERELSNIRRDISDMEAAVEQKLAMLSTEHARLVDLRAQEVTLNNLFHEQCRILRGESPATYYNYYYYSDSD